MTSAPTTSRTSAPRRLPRRKAAYHHGRLRDALVAAAHRLIGEHGPEGFTLADACRLAGVSTAAPYRHFADRAALVEAVAMQGFTTLAEWTRTARDRHPPGSVAGIVAMGQAYVAFAAAEPAVFKLMFGRHPEVQHDNVAPPEGKACFQVLAEAVGAWLTSAGLPDRPYLDVALPLWTIVHGTAYLLIDHDFDAVAPGTDADALVEQTTVVTLDGLAAAWRRDNGN